MLLVVGVVEVVPVPRLVAVVDVVMVPLVYVHEPVVVAESAIGGGRIQEPVRDGMGGCHRDLWRGIVRYSLV